MEDSELWRVDEIASYLKLAKKTVQNRVINSDGFPAPRILRLVGGKMGTKRWVSSEVKAWAMGTQVEVQE